MRNFVLFSCLAVSACANLPATINTVVADGQLFCATVTASGPLVVQIIDATAPKGSSAITVTNKAASYVADICRLVNGIPVIPPANPASAPTVAVIPAKS